MRRYELESGWNQDYKTLRILSMMGFIFTPPITVVSTDSTIGLSIALGFTALFALLYVMTYKSVYIKRNAYFFICAFTSLAALSTIINAYFNSFSINNMLVLIMISFSIILVFKRTRDLLIYMAIILTFTTAALLPQKDPGIGHGIFLGFMLMLSILSYFYVRNRLEMLTALKNSEKDHRNLIDISPQAVIIIQYGKIVYVNSITLEIFSAENVDCFMNKSLFDFIHPDYQQILKKQMDNVSFGEKESFLEQKMIRSDGRVIDVETNIIGTNYQNKTAYMCIIKDISERKTSEQKLIEAESKYRNLVESALVGVYLLKEMHLVYVNPHIEKLLGYKKEELYNMDITDILLPKDRIKLSAGSDNYCDRKVELSMLKKNGSVLIVETSASPINVNGESLFICTLVDITHIRKTEEQIKHMAYHDALTGLPNRYNFNESLNQVIELSNVESSKFSLMFIDLDRFKVINDTLGHKFGDIVLQRVSKKIVKCVRKSDIVSRYGGDEFVIILNNTDMDGSARLAQRILNEFCNPIRINGREVFISPSIGICLYPDDGDDTDSLVKNADAAMYLAKERGRNNYQFYSFSINEAMSRKVELENGLRKALANNEFVLYYQPLVDVKTGNLAGMEALIRWQNPKFGLISPGEFIPLAEETDLIISIGEWVLKTACNQNRAWQKEGFPYVPVSVNVSGRQIKEGNFLEIVKTVIDESGLNPRYLEIEITESTVQEIDMVSQIVSSLKSMGIGVSIDDFGTGYSTLNLIKDISVNYLKIGPTFTKDLAMNTKSETLIKSITDMGHRLELCVIAEGVEEKSQMLMLKQCNCDLFQGYYFSRPLPVKDFEEFWKKSADK